VIFILNPFAARPERGARSGIRWLLFTLLAALPLLAHGCHGGDVDHELCAPDSPQGGAER
jgi:hypothetical protein